jgi:DNA-binding NarL/FixJ family response regulator
VTEVPAADGGVRVVLVDDHELLREGVREILAAVPDLDVVGEAGTSAEAVELVGATRPDVVLLDVKIPGEPVTATVRRIAEVSPATAVLILTISDPPDLVLELVAAGIRGYLLKSVSRHELVGVIRAARRSSDTVTLSLSRETLLRLTFDDETGPAAEAPVLSERELDVVRLAAEALSNIQIATRLALTEAAVKRHLRSVFAKLGAVSRIDAVNKAVAVGLLDPPVDRRAAERI